MARKLVDFTEDGALRATIPPTLSYFYVRNLVETHLGADAAAMLAEPQVVPNVGKRQWLIEAPVSAPAVRIDQAEPSRAETGREILSDIRARALVVYERLNATGSEAAKQQAIAILRAFEVPSDREYVWLVADQLALVAWGNVKANIAPLEPQDLALTYRRSLQPVAPSSATAVATPPVEPPIQLAKPRHSHSWVAAAFLWLLFIVLFATVGAKLLPACSLHIPATTLHWTWSAQCGGVAGDALEDLVAENIALDEGFRSLQILLQGRDYCHPPNALESRGADVLAPVQITLEWSTPDDLDLVVRCPNGRISPRLEDKPFLGNCGDGNLDVNSNFKMNHFDDPPAEHISWHQLPSGKYRIIVFPTYTVRPARPVPFTLTLRINDKVQICRGEVFWDGSAGYSLDWTLRLAQTGSPPSCAFANGALRVCHECGK